MVMLLMILALVGAIAGILYYPGKKVKNMLYGFNIRIPGVAYWILFYASFAFTAYFRSGLIAVYLAATLIFVFCDIIFILLGIFGVKKNIISKMHLVDMAVIVIAFIISVLWQYNAFHPGVKEYNVSMDGRIEGGLDAVFISDIHAGTAIREKQLKYMTDTVNEIKPDIILLGGDIFDESSSSDDIKNTCDALKEMDSVYGTYYISGNHDVGMYDDFEKEFEACGIKIIDDEAVLVDDKFYIVGRRDEGMGMDTSGRLSMDRIMKDVDNQYPVILLDHRPTYFDEDTGDDVDLLLCGHTHNGQIFPGNLFIGLFCDQAYGLEKHNGTDVVVSSGFGAWGFPLRSGSRSELVRIHID